MIENYSCQAGTSGVGDANVPLMALSLFDNFQPVLVAARGDADNEPRRLPHWRCN